MKALVTRLRLVTGRLEGSAFSSAFWPDNGTIHASGVMTVDEQTPEAAQPGEPIAEFRSEGTLRDCLVGLFLLALGLATFVGGIFVAAFFSATIFFSLAGGTLLYFASQTRGLRLIVCSKALI